MVKSVPPSSGMDIQMVAMNGSHAHFDQSGIRTHAPEDQRLINQHTEVSNTLSWRLRPLGHLTRMGVMERWRVSCNIDLVICARAKAVVGRSM